MQTAFIFNNPLGNFLEGEGESKSNECDDMGKVGYVYCSVQGDFQCHFMLLNVPRLK